jgi:hypothetical protein
MFRIFCAYAEVVNCEMGWYKFSVEECFGGAFLFMQLWYKFFVEQFLGWSHLSFLLPSSSSFQIQLEIQLSLLPLSLFLLLAHSQIN